MSHANGPRTGRPSIYAPRGMVSSPHYLASESGLKALRQGGSAVDAAIALNLTMEVVYSHMAGIGGDGFWLLAGGNANGVEAIRASGPSWLVKDEYLLKNTPAWQKPFFRLVSPSAREAAWHNLNSPTRLSLSPDWACERPSMKVKSQNAFVPTCSPKARRYPQKTLPTTTRNG